jgi:hypothetical protein
VRQAALVRVGPCTDIFSQCINLCVDQSVLLLSAIQVQNLLDTQSVMLRRVIASNAVLRDEWRRSKEKLLLAPEVWA